MDEVQVIRGDVAVVQGLAPGLGGRLWHPAGLLRDVNDIPNFVSTLHFSFATFATLGYSDPSYGPEHPWFRLLSTSEAWVRVISIALFVAVIARKILQ